MPARLSVHFPDRAALVRVLDDGASVTLGRSSDCTFVLDHASVSRRHAELSQRQGHWIVQDLGSKNGVCVGGARVAEGRLGDRDWFSVGDVFCELEQISPAQAMALAERADQQRSASRAWIERIERADSNDALLRDVLAAIVELTGCRRGFLLAGDAVRGMKVAASHGLDPAEMAKPKFSGSSGAIDRAMKTRQPVFLSNAEDRRWLGTRASVVAQNIRALSCVPLTHEERLLGLAYVDSDEAGKIFTELDADILDAFAKQAAMTLALHGLSEQLEGIASWLSLDANPGGAVPEPDKLVSS